MRSIGIYDGKNAVLARDPARLRLALLRSSALLRSAQDDTGGLRFTRKYVFNQVSACQEKRTENVKHSLSFSCQFEYTALWKAPIRWLFVYFSCLFLLFSRFS